MDWTCSYKPGQMTVRQFLETQFNNEDDHCAMRILDCAVVGQHTAYVAMEWVMKDTGRRQVIGVVFRIERTSSGDGETVCWQDMSESMLPQAFDCPESILGLLTPTDDPSALKWRELCRQRQAGTKSPRHGVRQKECRIAGKNCVMRRDRTRRPKWLRGGQNQQRC